MSIMKNLTKWQNYAHYLLLTGGLIGVMHINGIHYFHSSVINFAVLFASIFVIDTVIHALFTIAPEPIKWED